jgi:hypothetical protein
MSNSPIPQAPSDVSLLLRADAEQCWLHREVVPVLRELEAGKASAEQDASAALAYLEAMWSEATIRARATDAAHGELRCQADPGAADLSHAAKRYHAAVRVLRELIAARIERFADIATTMRSGEDYGQGELVEAPANGGCAPRAA